MQDKNDSSIIYELEGMGRKQMWPFSWYYINNYLERLNETAEKLGNLVAETGTRYLMNTNMEHFDYTNII
jgi:hypothetical protein